MAKYTLVLLRHGESEYTQKNLFCGFAHDADLTDVGVKEAIHAGQLLKEHGFQFDIAFTSVLKRAIKTVYYVQEELDCHWIPVVRSWRLNERHYGALQGLNKEETAAKYGEELVKSWRRSYDARPPPLEMTDPRWQARQQYAAMDQSMIPTCESLRDTVERTIPLWYDKIAPTIKAGRNVLIAAHGNSLRGIVKFLENISDADIMDVEVPTAIPLVYELGENFRPVTKYYLGTEEEISAALAKVSAQRKAKP